MSVNTDCDTDGLSTWTRLEQCLLPAPETIRWNRGELVLDEVSTAEKVAYYVKNVFLFIGLVLAIPFTLIYDCWKGRAIEPIQKNPDIVPSTPVWPPDMRGFATSLFQTSGLGTKWSASPDLKGKCDWDEWMDKEEHIINFEKLDPKEFFTDILSDPTDYIEMLKEQNVTAHRFSLEWSVIEPSPGEWDEKAIDLYRNFIKGLIEAGITPFITLSHFVLPEWFYESGGFQKLDNIDKYVNFGMRAMDLFPEVKDWWSFNELGVKAFQQAREVYPTDVPEGSSLPTRVRAAGIATRNMLIAHCKLHQKVNERFPGNQVGVTHQWLKFDTESGNWLERLIAYFFTKFGFTPIYQFFKEGRYSFAFPFMANIQFEIPKGEFDENDHFLMRLGVQAYPKPMVKAGLNHGEVYPGLASAIKNLPLFSFGSTCEPEGTVMRFGPRWNAKAIREFLDDAFALTKNVYITEFGSDARVHKWGSPGFEKDDVAQAKYLKQLIEEIQGYTETSGREIKGIFAWSDLRRQLEWENGFECVLGQLEAIVDEKRRLVGWTKTPASEVLKEAYQKSDLGQQEVS